MTIYGRLRRTASLAMALSPGDWLRVTGAVARLVHLEAQLRCRQLPDVARRFGAPLALDERPPPPEFSDEHLTMSQWNDLIAVQRACKRWPFGDTCLRRALAFAPTMVAQAPQLRVGVARLPGGEFGAHAWLEFQAFSVGLDPLIDYTTLRSPAS